MKTEKIIVAFCIAVTGATCSVANAHDHGNNISENWKNCVEIENARINQENANWQSLRYIWEPYGDRVIMTWGRYAEAPVQGLQRRSYRGFHFVRDDNAGMFKSQGQLEAERAEVFRYLEEQEVVRNQLVRNYRNRNDDYTTSNVVCLYREVMSERRKLKLAGGYGPDVETYDLWVLGDKVFFPHWHQTEESDTDFKDLDW